MVDGYTTITLVKRENVNCSSISEDEFVSKMFSDIIEAEEKYNELYAPEYVASIIRHCNSYVESYRKRAERIAEKKWKTEKKRNVYIAQEVAKANKEFNRNAFYYDLSFFDFDVHPESNGLSGDCCISINRLTFDSLRRCFESVKDNYYFKNASGWKLEYEAHENDHKVCFRPYITLIMPEDVEAKYHKAAEDLSESIRKFYEGCTYWGD